MGLKFELLQSSERLLPRCSECRLHEQCKSPKMPPTGEGRRRILVVAEAPGAEEDQCGIQLIGKSGQFLRAEMRRLGWDLDRDCWKTNALCCRPPNNRTPTAREIDTCRPNVLNAIRSLKPRVIVLLGNAAVESVIGSIWTQSVGSLTLWLGRRIPLKRWNCWACPTFHPSYVLREQKNPVVGVWFRRHLEQALLIQEDPCVPDYMSQVVCEMDASKAAERLRKQKTAFAFDFETNRLKPEHPESQILSCAVADDSGAIAFPWQQPAIDAMSHLLRSDIPKVGANIKFEERWVRRLMGYPVRAWAWDVVQAAHVLDNRSRASNLKFQSFVELGQEPYDQDIAPLKVSEGGNDENRLRFADWSKLLLYNGLDSLLTWHLAKRQYQKLAQERHK